MIKGLILQPISRKKKTWDGYSESSNNDFLNYFQNTFQEKIGEEFWVNHNTEKFSDYLLIPYFTENQKCFGAYYINNSKKLLDCEYKWAYLIDYSKSYNFSKILSKQDILTELDFNNKSYEKVKINSILNYYLIDNPSENILTFLKSFCNNNSLKKEI
jgi:hypothetical protein